MWHPTHPEMALVFVILICRAGSSKLNDKENILGDDSFIYRRPATGSPRLGISVVLLTGTQERHEMSPSAADGPHCCHSPNFPLKKYCIKVT